MGDGSTWPRSAWPAGWIRSRAPWRASALDARPGTVTFRAADGAVASAMCRFRRWRTARREPPRRAGPSAASRSRRMPARSARSACCWSGSADTRPGCLPARTPSWPPPRSVRGWCTGAVPRAEPHSTASPGAGRSRPREALGAAADTAAAVFAPYAGRLDAVVLGGDRRAIAALRADPRLRPYFSLAVERFLTVPDPRLAVLRSTPQLFRAIRIADRAMTGPAAHRPGLQRVIARLPRAGGENLCGAGGSDNLTACNRSCRDGPPRCRGRRGQLAVRFVPIMR